MKPSLLSFAAGAALFAMASANAQTVTLDERINNLLNSHSQMELDRTAPRYFSIGNDDSCKSQDYLLSDASTVLRETSALKRRIHGKGDDPLDYIAIANLSLDLVLCGKIAEEQHEDVVLDAEKNYKTALGLLPANCFSDRGLGQSISDQNNQYLYWAHLGLANAMEWRGMRYYGEEKRHLLLGAIANYGKAIECNPSSESNNKIRIELLEGELKGIKTPIPPAKPYQGLGKGVPA